MSNVLKILSSCLQLFFSWTDESLSSLSRLEVQMLVLLRYSVRAEKGRGPRLSVFPGALAASEEEEELA